MYKQGINVIVLEDFVQSCFYLKTLPLHTLFCYQLRSSSYWLILKSLAFLQTGMVDMFSLEHLSISVHMLFTCFFSPIDCKEPHAILFYLTGVYECKQVDGFEIGGKKEERKTEKRKETHTKKKRMDQGNSIRIRMWV